MGRKFNNQQKQILVEFLENHIELVSRKQTPTFTPSICEALWNELATKLNSVPLGALKDIEGWKKTLISWKYNAKKRMGTNEGIPAACGPCGLNELSPLEQRLIGVTCGTAIEGQLTEGQPTREFEFVTATIVPNVEIIPIEYPSTKNHFDVSTTFLDSPCTSTNETAFNEEPSTSVSSNDDALGRNESENVKRRAKRINTEKLQDMRKAKIKYFTKIASKLEAVQENQNSILEGIKQTLEGHARGVEQIAEAIKFAAQVNKQTAEAALIAQKTQAEASLIEQKRQAEAALIVQKAQAEAALIALKTQAEASLIEQKKQAEAALIEQKKQAEAFMKLAETLMHSKRASESKPQP